MLTSTGASLRPAILLASLGIVAGILLGVLGGTAGTASAHEPGCKNNNHELSFAGNCGPQGQVHMLCATANRTAPGFYSWGPAGPTHAPNPVGSGGATPNKLQQTTRGVLYNYGCGSVASATWLLISNGWISRSALS